jgi:hypothetical protein
VLAHAPRQPVPWLIFDVSQESMKPMAKAMSDQRLATLVYHGWTLKSASVDPATDTVSEYYLEWDLPEAERRPTEDEAKRFSQLSVIDDVFAITGRGIVITPGFPRAEEKRRLKVGDHVVLLDGRRRAFTAEVRGIEFFSPPSPKGWPLFLGCDLTKEDVHVGMSVWIRE